MAKAAAAIKRADPSGLALADLQAKLAAEARRAAAGPAPVDERAEGGAEEGAGGAEAQPAPIAAKAGPGKPRPAPPKFANPPTNDKGGEQREEEAPPSAAAPPAPKPKPHEALRGGLNVRAKAKEDAAAVALRRAREKFEREMAILQRAEGLEEEEKEEEEEDGAGAHGDLWAPSGKAYQL